MNRTSQDVKDCNTNFRLDKEKLDDSQAFNGSHHSELYAKIRTQIIQSGCFENVRNIVVGISGGVDSSVLLHALSTYQKEANHLNIVALHVNHRQRGAESDHDEGVAKSISNLRGIPFHSISLPQGQTKSEEELRQLRYEAFHAFAKEHSMERIVLAHHLDDQVETFLFRLIRGADVRGLSAMKTFNPPFVRPMLYCTREEILREAQRYHVPFVEDSSNFFTGPARNFIRNILIPSIRAKLDPQVSKHVFDAALSMQEIDLYITHQAIEMIEKTKTSDGSFPVSKLREIPSVIRKKMFQITFAYIIKDKGSMSRDHVEMIDRWMGTTQSPKYLLLPHKVKVEKSKGVLRFTLA